MSNLSNIRIYDIFRKDLRLPDDKAFELVQAIDDAVKGNGEGSLKDVATKAFVREEIYLTKEVLREEMHLMKDVLKDEIHLTKESLNKAIFWSGIVQFLAIVGAMIGIFNFMLHR